MKPFTHANVTWLTHWLAVGGDLSPDPNKGAKQFAEIRDQFDVVIDTRVEANDADLWAGVPTVQYVHLPTDDAVGHTIPAWVFHRAIDTVFDNPDIDTRWKDDDGHSDVSSPILVHCHMGINRGPSVAMALLLAAGWDPIDAFELIRARRPVAAVYYAQDALSAWHTYKADYLGADTPDDLAYASRQWLDFDAHYDAVMTPEVMQQINHVIRTNHQRYYDELQRS